MNQMTQMNQAQLLHWINMVSFAVVDITEYLDTHPIDAEAICYFNHHIEMRRNAMQVYADKFGPLTIDTANPDAYWDWAKQPLPWEGGGCYCGIMRDACSTRSTSQAPMRRSRRSFCRSTAARTEKRQHRFVTCRSATACRIGRWRGC